MNTAYVQYGCGLSAPEGWRNFDASPTLRLQRLPVVGRRLHGGGLPLFPSNVEYGDIVKGLPVPAGSCRGVYCSHVLEHLALADFRTALRNTRTMLAEGGIFRFVLPDLEHLAREYVASTAPDASIVFMEQSMLGKPSRARGASGLLRTWMGNSAHLWMWDYKSMSAELTRAGFRGVRRAQLGDSADPHFAEVEDPGRWTDQLGVECMR